MRADEGSIGELVRDGENGRVFHTSKELAEQLVVRPSFPARSSLTFCRIRCMVSLMRHGCGGCATISHPSAGSGIHGISNGRRLSVQFWLKKNSRWWLSNLRMSVVYTICSAVTHSSPSIRHTSPFAFRSD